MRKVFLTTTVLSLFLIFFDRSIGAEWARDWTTKVFTPLEVGFYRTGVSLVNWGRFISKMPLIYRENEILRVEINSLLSLKVENENLKRENIILKEQLGLDLPQELLLLEARILGGERRGTGEILLLNKGEKDGVLEGMNVIIKNFLVGRVEEVKEQYSVVLPVFSVHSKVPAVVAKDGERIAGLVVGDFNSKVELQKVLQEKKLEVGDLVSSSGQAAVYRSDLLIGRVVKVERKDNEIFQSAKLELFWDSKTLDTVFLIKR